MGDKKSSFLDYAPFIGSGLNFLGGLFSSASASREAEKNRQFQRQERVLTQQWQEDMMMKQNDLTRSNQEWSYRKFDSPSAQRRAMAIAGINPFVEGSALQAGVSSAQGAPSAPSGNPSSGSMPSGAKYQAQMMAAGALGDALQLRADLDLKKAQAENLRADAAEKQGRTLDPKLTLQQQRNSIKLQEAGIRKELADALCAEYDAQIRELKNAGDLTEQEQRLANMREDFKLKQKQQGATDAEIALAWQKWATEMKQQGLISEKINTEKSIQASNYASASKSVSETKTIDQIRADVARHWKDKHDESTLTQAVLVADKALKQQQYELGDLVIDAQRVQNNLNEWLANRRMARLSTAPKVEEMREWAKLFIQAGGLWKDFEQMAQEDRHFEEAQKQRDDQHRSDQRNRATNSAMQLVLGYLVKKYL